MSATANSVFASAHLTKEFWVITHDPAQDIRIKCPISWSLPQLCGFGECLDPLLGDGVVDLAHAASPDEQYPIEHIDQAIIELR